jgi:NADH-quinone oxidoreductase subunit L
MGWFLQNAWLIPLLPLAACVLITFTPLRRNGAASGWLAIALMAVATALALGVFLEVARGVRVDASGQAALAQQSPGRGLGLLAPPAAEEGAFAFAEPNIVRRFRWAATGTTDFQMGYLVDAPVAAMLAMVTITGTMIHLFSLGYMAHDPRRARFFSFIALFTAAMLAMCLADNLLLFFMAWEIMGLCSYLLIGFWYERPTAYRAAVKAFVTTRVGDVLMLIGLAYLWTFAGSLAFGSRPGELFDPLFLASLAETGAGFFGLSVAGAIAFLIFCGTVGKSAQFPLHVWLPDAMEGPTPVSALIHAATMVAAGVFLVARMFPLFAASGILPLVAFVGAFTALFAALIAVAQYDIKRILAYSTLSQLGFMVAALGIGGWTAAMFHLLTHAFFKALLFLGAGAIIHQMEEVAAIKKLHHTDAYLAQQTAQDIRNMGGLRRYLPWTYAAYMAGFLALAGIPPFAGFWSKDEILADALNGGHPIVLATLLAAALLTAFYMTRQIVLVFFGNFRGVQPLLAVVPLVGTAQGVGHAHDGEHALAGEPGHTHSDAAHALHDEHAHAEEVEGGYDGTERGWHEDWRLTAPLIVLATFALLAGFFNLPSGLPAAHWLSDFFGREAATFSPLVAILATVLALLGIGLGVVLYRGAYVSARDADPLPKLIGARAFGLLHDKFYVDEFYAASVGRLVGGLARLWGWVDERVITPLVRGTGLVTGVLSRVNARLDDRVLNDGADALANGTVASGELARRSATGRIQDYVWLIFAGAVVLAVIYLYGF